MKRMEKDKDEIEHLIMLALMNCRHHADCMGVAIGHYRTIDKWYNIGCAILLAVCFICSFIFSDYYWAFVVGNAITIVALCIKPLFHCGVFVHKLNMRCYKEECLCLEYINLLRAYRKGKYSTEEAYAMYHECNKRQLEYDFFDDDERIDFTTKMLDNAKKITDNFFNINDDLRL